MSPADRFFEPLCDSDRRYFEAGARIARFGPLAISSVPDLAHIPAGCCGHLHADISETEAPSVLAALEAGIQSAGGGERRLYVRRPGDALRLAAETGGFTATVERAMIRPGAASDATPLADGVSIGEVVSHADWAEKSVFHDENQALPDGKSGQARAWVALERIKVDAGYMEAFLVRRGDRAIATFALARADGFVRVKNLVVDRRSRNAGVATLVLDWASAFAAVRGYPAIGLFALEGSAAHSLYGRCGFIEVGQIVEFSRPQPLRRPSASRPVFSGVSL